MTNKKSPPRRRVSISPDWRGAEAFIIGGGPSVQPEAVHQLRTRPGAHTIVINSAYRAFPWAEMLFFADERWIREELRTHPEAFAAYRGECIGVLDNDKYDSHAAHVLRETTEGLSRDPSKIFLHFTAARGAMNIALHKGVRRIVLVGMDNIDAPDGRTHFHEGYPMWRRAPQTYAYKSREFAGTVEPLREAGVEVINASPVSTLVGWPKADLTQWLKENPPC